MSAATAWDRTEGSRGGRLPAIGPGGSLELVQYEDFLPGTDLHVSFFGSRDCNALSPESLQPSSKRQRLRLSMRSVLHCLQPLIWDYLKTHDLDAISIRMTTTIMSPTP